MAGPLIFVLILAVIGAVAFLGWQAKQKRRAALRSFALQQNMEFSVADPYGIPVAYPFHLFGLGDGRGCENVMTGTWHELPVKEADYWYYTESSDSKGHRTKTYHRYSVVVADPGLRGPVGQRGEGEPSFQADRAPWLPRHRVRVGVVQPHVQRQSGRS